MCCHSSSAWRQIYVTCTLLLHQGAKELHEPAAGVWALARSGDSTVAQGMPRLLDWVHPAPACTSHLVARQESPRPDQVLAGSMPLFTLPPDAQRSQPERLLSCSYSLTGSECAHYPSVPSPRPASVPPCQQQGDTPCLLPRVALSSSRQAQAEQRPVAGRHLLEHVVRDEVQLSPVRYIENSRPHSRVASCTGRCSD